MFFKVRELMEMGWELERFCDLFYLLKNIKTCENCGCVFTYNAYSAKTKLCSDCKKKERYKKQYINYLKNKTRHKT